MADATLFQDGTPVATVDVVTEKLGGRGLRSLAVHNPTRPVRRYPRLGRRHVFHLEHGGKMYPVHRITPSVTGRELELWLVGQ